MRRLRALAYRFAGLLGKSRYEREMAEELESHFEMHIADNIRACLSPREARLQANLKFGGVAGVKESYRDRASLPFFDTFHQDVRYGLRQLIRNPGFTATAVLLLALGIGANAAIYSFLDAMLVRQLPVRDPGSLVLLKWHVKGRAPVARGKSGESHQDPERGYVSGSLPYPFFETLARSPIFRSVFSFSSAGGLTLISEGSAETVQPLFVSGDFFQGLGVVPAQGRLIASADDRQGAQLIAVISHAFWQTQFAGNPAVVGMGVLINGRPATIVGVAPPEFYGVNSSGNPQIYLPIRHLDSMFTAFIANRRSRYTDEHWYWAEIMGRLSPGVSREQAEAALATSFSSWVDGTAETPEERKSLPKLFVISGATGLDELRVYFSKPLFVLMGMVALILVIACANVANLMLARATARRREIAVRQGLGASRWRMIRQLFTESILLGLLGGAAGIALAWPGMRGLVLLMAAWRPTTLFRAELNWNVVALATALGVATGILFGLAPALSASSSQVGRIDDALKESRIGGSRSRWNSLPRGILVALQISLSLVLVSGAGLFVTTLVNLRNVNLGFNQEHLLLFEANARQAGYSDQTLPEFYNQVLVGLRGAPGVRNATVLTEAPFVGRSGTGIEVPGSVAPPARSGTSVNWVDAAFFATLQIPLLKGRDIDERDTAQAPAIVVVNEAFVATHFPNQEPLGRTIIFNSPENRPATIVGVAKNGSFQSLQEAVEPMVFGPFSQHARRIDRMTFAVRTEGDPLAVIAMGRQIMHAVDSRVPLQRAHTQERQIQQTLGQQRLFAILGTAFAALALLIAAIGLYGTMVYNIGRRTAEFGIRMALGAQRNWVVRLVMKDALTIVAAGLAIGLPVVYFASRLVESFLFGIQPRDPWMLITSIAVLAAAALIAAWLPARRASRIDPMVALRHE